MVKRLHSDPELDGLIRQLNASARASEAPNADGGDVQAAGDGAPGPLARPELSQWSLPRATEDGGSWLAQLLSRARVAGASDLLLVVDAPPVVRINGRLQPLGDKPLSPQATATLCAGLVPDSRRARLETAGAVDFTRRWPDAGHCRCNIHLQRGHWSAAVRLFPDAPPELEALNLPAGLARFSDLEYGLVLVTGPTGSGKSTTLAALIRRILARRAVHLITIEDPVEYEHAHTESVVEHVEIGRDATSFAAALRSVLRQDPDVLLIGEMRDPESMSIAITAAETGHLVLSTLHTGDSPQTVHRILDSYPANQMDAVRAQLSVSLAGIVSQQLLPRIDGTGRVPAVEILVATHAVRNLIRLGKVPQLRSQLTLERQAGMLDLDRSLARLAFDGRVDLAEARARSRQPEEFDAMVRHAGAGGR